jgi:hypothetical protein
MEHEDKIKELIIGIRFSRSFRISDISGEIVDDILYSPESPLGADFFPIMRESSNREKILVKEDVDKKVTDYLRINTDDLILKIKIDNDYSEKKKWLENEVIPFIYSIFKNYNIRFIRRVGIVFGYNIERKDILDGFIKTFTEGKMESTSSAHLGFSEKFSDIKSIYSKSKDDYKKAIYLFEENDNKLYASFDFQHYFKPAIVKIDDISFDSLIEDAQTFLEKKFYPLLKDEE